MNILLLPKDADTHSTFRVDNPEQVAHIQQVLGLSVGDSIKVGVLSGNIGSAVIKQMSVPSKTGQNKADAKAYVILESIQCPTPPPAKLDLTVVLALPRPKVLRRLIMDMTAMGVGRIILVNSYRTDKSYWQSPMLKRINEFVQEGLQQGVDTVAPVIELKKRFKPFVEDELALLTPTQLTAVAHPYADSTLRHFEQTLGRPQILCIGAEGGWIDYEIELLKANGCHSVSLGSRILRTEAAVNALCGRYF